MNNTKERPEGMGYFCLCKFCVNSGTPTKKALRKQYTRALRKQNKKLSVVMPEAD